MANVMKYLKNPGLYSKCYEIFEGLFPIFIANVMKYLKNPGIYSKCYGKFEESSETSGPFFQRIDRK